MRITKGYLSTKEKVVVVNSKLESIEVESSKLRKDLIAAMDETNKANEKVKELSGPYMWKKHPSPRSTKKSKLLF